MIKGTIAIEGIEMHAYHGVYAAERKYGNRFVVDVYVLAPIEAAGDSDQLSQTVNYQAVYQLVLDILEDPVDLLETLVMGIARRVLAQFETVEEVKVRVTKSRPMAMEQCRHTYVEVKLER